MSHVSLTDCDSLDEHLISPKMTQAANKRLAIDLKALRQQVWEISGERTYVVDSTCGGYPRWIDTSNMMADPLAKTMAATRLEDTLMTGLLDLRPTEESLFIKAKNRASRKKANEYKANVAQVWFTVPATSTTSPRCTTSSTSFTDAPFEASVSEASDVRANVQYATVRRAP